MKREGAHKHPLSKWDLELRARPHNATVVDESSGRYCVYQCESPAGKVWAASSTHALRVEWMRGDRKGRNEAILDALTRMQEGLADCGDADCDYCHAEEA